ncbi:MAG: hypothetical protein GX298_02125 [Planctomycetes bacterium]|nr:hypothetical protein [Planctomycetota bacterium]
MAQQQKTLRPQGEKPYGFSIAGWAAAGVSVLVLLCCMTLAIADGTIYLRAMVPNETETPFYPDITKPDEMSSASNASNVNDDEERLLVLLAEEDTDSAYAVVNNDQRWRVVRMRVTAYCPCSKCCGKFSDGVTACNHRIQWGDVFVAADKKYRFGTEMIVPGYNDNQPVKVMDRGRVIKGDRLDVFFNAHAVAQKWGTRTLDVLVREN